ncbi:MAG TPA: hypothetical protein VNK03_04010 [Gammaproteobacteria bacterium]|nr:hypothetical protein [Gammaproteobacteria bacterium]
MTEKTKQASNDVEEIKGRLKGLLGEIKSLDKDDLKDLGKEYSADIMKALRVEDMKDTLNQSFDKLEDKIKSTPLRSAAVCMGIGFLLAKVFGTWKNG